VRGRAVARAPRPRRGLRAPLKLDGRDPGAGRPGRHARRGPGDRGAPPRPVGRSDADVLDDDAGDGGTVVAGEADRGVRYGRARGVDVGEGEVGDFRRRRLPRRPARRVRGLVVRVDEDAVAKARARRDFNIPKRNVRDGAAARRARLDVRGAVGLEDADAVEEDVVDAAGRLGPDRDLCGIPTDSRYLQLECSGTNFWGLSL